ncbi:MAG TPA: outer membrane beta-barrel protein [Chitinophagaceae bacterium]
MKVFFVTGMLMLALNGIAQSQPAGAKPVATSKDSSNKDSTHTGWSKAVKLKGVVVTARKPLVEQKVDRTIVNVDALISNTGSNALDVLGNTPGLQVDDEGSISLKGRANVLVLVDGRPTQLSGTDLAAYLKSLPSGVLDRIEIMSNPPARYQASGTGGIINIITKKSKSPGFNGSVTGNIGTGLYGSSNNSLIMSYRNDKWSFSGNARFSVLNSYFHSDRRRNYTNPDGSPLSTRLQNDFESSNRRSTGGELRIGYSPSKTAVLELDVQGSVTPYDEKGDYRARFFDAAGIFDSSMYVTSHLVNSSKSGYTALNFRRPFKTAGKDLTINTDYYANRLQQHQLLGTTIYAADNSLKSRDELLPVHPSSIDAWSANVDYTTPLAKQFKLETGERSSYGRVNSITNYTTANKSNSNPDSSVSDRFLFEETIHAGYIDLSREGRRLQVKAGLRVENTLSVGHQVGDAVNPDTSFRRSYTNFFPTVYFAYKTDSSLVNQFFLSFARRINRPDYNQLNPASFYFDKSTVYTGNPLLLPEFSYNTELSYVYKQTFSTTLLYSDTRNLVMSTFQQLGDRFVSMPVNIGRSVSRGLSFSGALPVTKWWTGLLYTEFFNNSYSSGPAAIALNSSGNAWRVSVNNQFRLDDGWSAEISGFYRTNSILAQSILQNQWYVNTTVQKKLWKEKATLNLGLRDVFHTKTVRREINTLQQQTVFFVNSFDTRILSLSLTVRFGNEASAKAKQKAIDTKAAINQLKNGG